MIKNDCIDRDFNGKTVLVTGATGLIGNVLTKKLLEQGAAVYAVGRRMSKLSEVFKDYADNDQLFLCESDVSDELPCKEVYFDYIFHAAGPISGRLIKEKPADMVKVNVSGVENCLKRLLYQKEKLQKNEPQKKASGGRLIVFSSATVYGDSEGELIGVSEEDGCSLCNPASVAAVYPETKRMVEVLAGAYARQYGLDVCIARIAYVYGYSPVMPDTAFYEFVRRILNNEDIKINATVMNRRDNIYVEDAVSGILTVALRGESKEAYNVSLSGENGNCASASEIAECMAECAREAGHYNKKVLFGEQGCSSLDGIMLKNDKLKALGWNPETGLKAGIKKTLEYYFAYGTEKTI